MDSSIELGMEALRNALNFLKKLMKFFLMLQKILRFFDNSNRGYVVSFTDYNSIDDKFYKRIERDLVKV